MKLQSVFTFGKQAFIVLASVCLLVNIIAYAGIPIAAAQGLTSQNPTLHADGFNSQATIESLQEAARDLSEQTWAAVKQTTAETVEILHQKIMAFQASFNDTQASVEEELMAATKKLDAEFIRAVETFDIQLAVVSKNLKVMWENSAADVQAAFNHAVESGEKTVERAVDFAIDTIGFVSARLDFESVRAEVEKLKLAAIEISQQILERVTS